MKTMIACATPVLIASAAFAQVGVDGVFGSEWSVPGVITEHVTYNPSTPEHDFSGYPSNSETAYNTYMRADATHIYFAVVVDPSEGGSAAGYQWANLYFSTTLTGSNIGMEVTNNRFFRPGISGYTANTGIAVWSSSIANGVIELAIPFSFFTNDPLGIGFTTANPTTGSVQWRLSQSFGYAAAGGPTFGADRLGIVSVPTPGAAAALGLGAVVGLRRRRR